MIHVAGRRKEFNAVISLGLFIMDGTLVWIFFLPFLSSFPMFQSDIF